MNKKEQQIIDKAIMRIVKNKKKFLTPPNEKGTVYVALKLGDIMRELKVMVKNLKKQQTNNTRK